MCRDKNIDKDVDTIIALMAFTSVGVLYLESKRRNSGSSRCLNCHNCPCPGSNPKAQQD
jgi:hypothetical protein